MISYVLEGLERAAGRLEESRFTRDPGDSFVAVVEALLWVMALDDRFKADGRHTVSRRNDEYGRGIPGVRHVWNLLKHTELDDLIDVTEGAAWPLRWPVTWFELSWKPFAELPTMPESKRSPRQEASYQSELAGRPVRLTLGGVVPFMRQQAARLGYELSSTPDDR